MKTRKHRLRRAGTWCWTYIKRAPGTYVWLFLLLITANITQNVSPDTAERILLDHSSNLDHLSSTPVRALIQSGLWTDPRTWLFYFLQFNLFHVPAERWLGTLRWLYVALIAHVVATFGSQGLLYLAMRNGLAPESAQFVADYGVSYSLAAVQAVLVYAITAPWRYVYLAGVLLYYGIPLLSGWDFTAIGHAGAVLIGLACYPLTRGRTGRFDPPTVVRGFIRRLREARA